MRIVHGVIDHQIRNRIAERMLRALRHQTLERERVLALVEVLRKQGCEDRLPRQAQMQAGQVVVLVERADELRLHDRMIRAVQHVLFARPNRLDRRARHLLRDQDGLRHVIRPAAPAEAATTDHLVDVALVRGQA